MNNKSLVFLVLLGVVVVGHTVNGLRAKLPELVPEEPGGLPTLPRLKDSMFEPMQGGSGRVLTSQAKRGKEQADKYGISWVSVVRTEMPWSTSLKRVHRTKTEVHFHDGRVLVNPSLVHDDLVNDSQWYSEADLSIFRNIRVYNNETNQ